MPRCFYEALQVDRSASSEEIKSSYRKLALRLHPDKNQDRIEEATAEFKEIQNAYEVLSDKNERAWYDGHRESIINSDSHNAGARDDSKPERPDDTNLWAYFSASAFFGYGRGPKSFYTVYGDVFRKLHVQEQNSAHREGKQAYDVPDIGHADTPYPQVAAFYNHWTNFVTVKDFAWCDEFNLGDAPNRKVRRLMEEENKKLRRKEKKEFNDAVRQLALFVKKRDKRVLEHQLEIQRVLKEKEEEQKKRKQAVEREKALRASRYVEPEWARNEADEEGEEDDGDVDNWWDVKGDKGKVEEESQELFCVACNKRFRSEKQWGNHERSKKHLEMIDQLRDAMLEEEGELSEIVDDAEAPRDRGSKKMRETNVGSDAEEEGDDDWRSAGEESVDEGGDVSDEDEETGEEVSARNESGNGGEDCEDVRQERKEVGEAGLGDNVGERKEEMEGKRSQSWSEDVDQGTYTEDVNVPSHSLSKPEESKGVYTAKDGATSNSNGRSEYSKSREEEGMGRGVGDPMRLAPIRLAQALPEAPVKKGPVNKSAARRLAKQMKKSGLEAGRNDGLIAELLPPAANSGQAGQPKGVARDGMGGGMEGGGAGLGAEMEEVSVGGGGVGREERVGEGEKGQKESKKGRRRTGSADVGVDAVAKEQRAVRLQQEERRRGGGRRGKEKYGKVTESEFTCSICAEEYETRNQLFKHIAATGHAAPKS